METSSSLIASLRAKSQMNLQKSGISVSSNKANVFSLPKAENNATTLEIEKRYFSNKSSPKERFISMSPSAREHYISTAATFQENILPIIEEENTFESYLPSGDIDWTSLLENLSLNPMTLNALALRNSLGSTYKNQSANNTDQLKGEVNSLTKVSKLPITANALLDKAKGIATKITSLYEGGQVTGNFDGQGISVGYLQWNMGSGTLQPLLKEMASSASMQSDFNEIFKGSVVVNDKNGNKIKTTMANALRDVLGRSKSEQLSFARSINDKNNRIVEPWKAAFNSLIKNDKFVQIQDKYAKPYLNTATNIINDSNFGVKTVRGYALAFDIAVQNGSVKASAKNLIQDALAGKSNKLTNYNNASLSRNQRSVIKDLNERLKGVTDPDLKKMYYTAAAVAISSNDRFAKDVWARKSAIIAGTGKVHGQNFDFSNSVGLSDNVVV
ncbi:MAG: hypothetical protein CVV02_15415 [Firmicutes bacterium HGW-Firmicutes-7]|nr:MAG: hypothetical protein CVV02_15415 [Firmicutes bacterium HGW-Firmicutes-7]